ncbi:MAG TPA: hypothetical protein ENH65_11175 [Candidatus Aminicenantes bacterium]|nr:hypothetical protein [Candidatus Aminicenantes bacterium]
MYENNENYNETIKSQAKKTEGKINTVLADKRTKLEKLRRKQQIELDAERQKYYDQKGEIPERKRIEKLRIFEQQATEATETFKQEIDRIEIDRFKALQNLQGRVDAQMDHILKNSVLATIKQPGRKVFTGIGGKLLSEQQTAQKTIDEFESLSNEKQARIKEGLRRYRVFADNILQYMVSSGRISQESYDAIKANNEEYFMLQRVIQARPGESMESLSLPTSKAFGVTKEVLYSIKGSGQIIARPYESLLEFAHKAIIESDRNYVLKSYVDFMKQATKGSETDAGRIAKIINPAVEGDKNTIAVFRSGEKFYSQLDPDIYRSMKGIVDQLYALPPIIRFFPRLLRASVTNNPVFAARNLLRDYQTMLVVSDNVKSIGNFVPAKLRKAGDLKPKDAYDVFGAGQGGYHLLNENFYYRTLEEKSAELAGKKGNILVKASDLAIHAGQAFGKLSGGSEKVTRMVEFRNSFKRSKKKGLDDYNAGIKAAFDARSLMDFAVIGEWMNVINQLIPFTNAKIQGLRVAKRGFVKNPLLFSIKAGMTIMFPQLLMRMMFTQDDEERYQQLPEYQRNMFWNIPVGTGWLMIPKPHDIAVTATMADMFYDTAMGNKVNYTGFNTAIFALLPMTRADMAGPMRTFVEILANKDFFRDSTIAYDDKKAMERRNYEWASRVGKLIGEPIGVDPRKVDHFIRGTLSYFGSQAMRLSDMGREDKKRNVADMTGFYKEEPIYNYKDVQWLQKQAELYELETEEYYMVIRWMIQEYGHMESDGQKREMGKAIREYSKYVKDLWLSYNIKEEAVGDYRQEFKEAVRKEAKIITNTPFIKDLKEIRKERKEFEADQ